MVPVAILNPATMELLSLFRGDTMISRCVWPDLHFSSLLTSLMFDSGKKGHNTMLICLSSDNIEEDHIQMNRVAHHNLQVKLGDLFNVHLCLDQIQKTCTYFDLLKVHDFHIYPLQS